MPSANDILYYTLVENPISTSALNCAKALTNAVGITGAGGPKVNVPPPELYRLAAAEGPYIKLAALSGATAVVIGAIASHKIFNNKEDKENIIERQRTFEIASRYHFYHTIALLGIPLLKHKFVPATLMLSGMILFCGSLYYFSFTNDKKLNKLTPIGGSSLIFGWISMML